LVLGRKHELTKEDAEGIGFRDNKIYEYIETLNKKEKDSETLEFIPMNREETIKVFEEFKDKADNRQCIKNIKFYRTDLGILFLKIRKN